MKTIREMVEDVKSREKNELIDAMMKHGKKVADGFKVRFRKDERPIIAGYLGDDPCDLVITSVKVTDDEVMMMALQKNDPYDEWEIEPEEVFAGHLSYVTEAVIIAR